MITANEYNPSKLQFNSLETLLSIYQYVGFQPPYGDKRYMVVTGGLTRGCAVSPTGIWCKKGKQQTYKEGYVIFETKEDLLEWMKG